MPIAAAFGRLCVETPLYPSLWRAPLQPPSGGCVLKPPNLGNDLPQRQAAAFGRLCVETTNRIKMTTAVAAAAFGRLCVETADVADAWYFVEQPPSGGCVLKHRIASHIFAR